MVKYIFNILVIMLLVVAAAGRGAESPLPCVPNATASWSVQDTTKPAKGNKRKDNQTAKRIKKVTFENFDQCYERAMKYYDNQQYLSAASLFEELYPLSLGTPRADTILYRFAECYYNNKDYSMAAFHFRDYVRRYPNTDKTEDAYYYCISAISKTSPDYSLDQSSTQYAIDEIKAFLLAYPNNAHMEECNVMLDDLRLKLARKDLEVLKLYYNTDHYEACQIAAKNFFNEYSYSPLMPEAVYYLVLNNYEYAKRSVERKKQERYKACVEACDRMERDYKDTKYYKETEKIAKEARKHIVETQNN